MELNCMMAQSCSILVLPVLLAERSDRSVKKFAVPIRHLRLCRMGRAVIRASPPCQQKNNKSQCPACFCSPPRTGMKNAKRSFGFFHYCYGRQARFGQTSPSLPAAMEICGLPKIGGGYFVIVRFYKYSF